MYQGFTQTLTIRIPLLQEYHEKLWVCICLATIENYCYWISYVNIMILVNIKHVLLCNKFSLELGSLGL